MICCRTKSPLQLVPAWRIHSQLCYKPSKPDNITLTNMLLRLWCNGIILLQLMGTFEVSSI